MFYLVFTLYIVCSLLRQVTHTLVPYAACKAIGEAQQLILDQLCPPANAASASAAATAAAAKGKSGKGGKGDSGDDFNQQVRAGYSRYRS